MYDSAETYPQIFSKNSKGELNKSHISLWFIQKKVFPIKNKTTFRNALEIYVQFMRAASKKLIEPFSSTISSLVIGVG